MANLPETSTYDAGVYQLETTDPVIGGPSGTSNAPLKNLANRTKYLKDHVDAMETDFASKVFVASEIAAHEAISDPHRGGVIGSMRNGKMSVATASATATITADEVIVETSLGGTAYKLPIFSKSINLATTGAGGMDTGSAPTSGFVALYAIYNPTTGTSALLARNASTLMGSVYGGSNMPSGYTASALLSVVPTDSSGKIVPCYQRDRKIWIIPVVALTTASISSSGVSLSLSSFVPANALSIGGFITAAQTSGTGGGYVFTLGGSASGIGSTIVEGYTGPNESSILQISDCPLITAQTVYYSISVGVGISGANVNLFINGYEI